MNKNELNARLMFSFFNKFGKNKLKFEKLTNVRYRLHIVYDQALNASRANLEVQKMLLTNISEINDIHSTSNANDKICFNHVIRDRKHLEIMVKAQDFNEDLLKEFLDTHRENELFLMKKSYDHLLYKDMYAYIEEASSCTGAIHKLL